MEAVIWKDVPGWEGEYKVSSDGQVYSVPRIIAMKNGTTRKVGGKILAQVKAGYGYWTVQLGAKKRQYVHRLVAIAFLGDMGSGYEVNHKDEDPSNNHLDNLEWLTKKENLDYGTRTKRSSVAAKEKAKPIAAMKDGEIVLIFASLHEAEKAGFHRCHVSECCRGKKKQFKGFTWCFANEIEKAAPGDCSTEDGSETPDCIDDSTPHDTGNPEECQDEDRPTG